MRPSRGQKLLAASSFFILLALAITFFYSAGVFLYPVIILASLVFILSLKLNVPVDGFLTGAIAAIASMGLVICVLVLSGMVELVSLKDNLGSILAFGLAIQLLVGIAEELSFRASIFQGLWESLGLWPSVVLSSAGFAVLHVPSMELVGLSVWPGIIALCTVFFAGATLALLYAYGGLFNAIAFHVVWNYMEYNIFSMGPLEGAVAVSKHGPDFITGGAFGPEASVVTLAVSALLALGVWLYYNKNGKAHEKSI